MENKSQGTQPVEEIGTQPQPAVEAQPGVEGAQAAEPRPASPVTAALGAEAPAPAVSGESRVDKMIAQAADELYDADATQVLTFETTLKGRGVSARVRVAHTLSPLTDELYVKYDKARDVRVSSAAGGAMDTKTSLLAASVALYDDLYGGHEPRQVRVSAAQKMSVVQDGLLACEIMPPPVVSVEEAISLGLFDDDADSGAENTIKLRCLFNSREVVTEHTLASPTADQLDRFNRLMTRARLVGGERLGSRETQMPSREAPLGKLYDELLVRVSGYRGRVPLKHKSEVITEHLSSEQEIVEGNSDA